MYIDDNGLKVINIPPALNYCEILVDLKKNLNINK